MQTISSTEARSNFSELLDQAKTAPIAIQKQGRDAAVLLSAEEYARLSADPVKRFHNICERISNNARERGLTDEIFDDIMAQDDD